MDPTEVVVDFISSFHTKFAGGIFWINCVVPEVISSGVRCIEKVRIKRATTILLRTPAKIRRVCVVVG